MKPVKNFLIPLILIVSYQLSNNLSAQNSLIILNGANIVMDGSQSSQTYIVVGEANPSGITRLPQGGHIHSENQYNYVKWLSGIATGSYTFPFGVGVNATDYIPFVFNKTAGNNNISVSTWSTDQQNLPHPAATNVAAVGNMTGITDSVLYALDRFWDIQASGNTADLTFSYLGVENTTSAPNGAIQAQHWNGTSWDAPVGPGIAGVTTGVGSLGPILGQNTFSPWTLIVPCAVDSVSQNLFICQGESISVGTNTYSNAGVYVDNLINILGCDSVVTTHLTISPTSNGTDVQSACYSYTWIDGVTYTANNTTATHTIIGGSANGCDSIVTLDLTINIEVTGTDTQTACDSYTWIDGITYSSDNNTATHTITGGAANGCDSIVTLDLTIVSPPNVTATSNSPICQGGILSLNATTINSASYVWTGPNNFTSQSQNPTINNTSTANSGTYEVITSLGNNCNDTSQVNVNINPTPVLSATIIQDSCETYTGQIVLNPSSPNPPFTYSWNNGSTDSFISELSEGTYDVTVSDAVSCSVTKSFEIYNNTDGCECFIYVANAFSPNSDGNNDFIPVRGFCITNVSFKIFNHWGNLVFETNMLNDGWDGYYKGNLQNSGVYAYILEATFENGKTIVESGDINLIR
ncbi:T9SS type B sorting domain-containing protein [Brumimicrobium oceani]|uniref:Ig-like domain-containing protein n=1 Tax=Brumimicrobium oceani TaxID=2100725 RepID=A0A2U2X346_9FLAO|nr:gliding motility-associated C-terminal domain-containing protein [Brumimicrobium oceani]PWH82197.1 hypothetical protein DIT68_13905 [Brumimicrobium oceani]